MTGPMRRSPVLPLLLIALLLGWTTGATSPPPKPSFTESGLFFELNDTDGDLGIHASLDGGPWTDLKIEGPNRVSLLDIASQGTLRTQGLTQLSFESAEPPFDELDPAVFFTRFPEGRYDISGVAEGGSSAFKSTAVLSHVLAAPPENILVSGVPASEDCDANVPLVTTPVVVNWDPVTDSHPEIGKPGSIKISRYQLFVEPLVGVGVKLSLDLPSTVTEFTVPTAVTDLGTEFKLEIIARTTTGNNTAVESCFRVQ